MTADNVLDVDAAPRINQSLPGSGYVEPRVDMMGHNWREGRCTGCSQTMAQARGVLCPAEACEADARGVEVPVASIEGALRALVEALDGHAIPGNAATEYREARKALGLP